MEKTHHRGEHLSSQTIHPARARLAPAPDGKRRLLQHLRAFKEAELARWDAPEIQIKHLSKYGRSNNGKRPLGLLLCL